MGKKLITVADVVATYGLSERTVRRYLAEGVLSARRCGKRSIRLDAEQVERELIGEQIGGVSA
jgi:excisionase family DNA binding protein